jgi:hypothetical protein
VTDLIHNYNAIANGVVLTSGNTGHTTVTIGGASTAVASTSSPIEGAASALLTPASGQICALIDVLTASSGMAGSMALRAAGAFSVISNVMQIRNASARTAYVVMQTDGRLRVSNMADVALYTTPNVYTSDDRIELLSVKGTTTSNGRVVFAVYSGDTTTLSAGMATVYDSGATTNTGTADMTEVRYGRSVGTTDVTAHRIDRVLTRSATTSLIGQFNPPVLGSVSLSGTGTLSLAGRPSIPGTVGFNGAGMLSLGGTPSIKGAAAHGGTGTLAANGFRYLLPYRVSIPREMELGHFWTTDHPVNPIEITVEPDDYLNVFNLGSAVLYNATGSPTATLSPVVFKDYTLTFPWPDMPFSSAGTYTLVPTLTSPEGGSLRLGVIKIIVQEDIGWHSLESARYYWADAPWQDTILTDLLDIAKYQCTEYVGSTTALTYLPRAVRRSAQLMQARNLWNASKVDPGTGGFGEDTFVIRPFPMDWVVKNLLRPKRAIPVVA